MKDIPGFEGRYAITTEGKIWSYPNTRHEGIWVKYQNTNKFLSVRLFKDSKVKTFYVHRLVLWAYGKTVSYKHIVHLNGNIFDNRLENLKYIKDN